MLTRAYVSVEMDVEVEHEGETPTDADVREGHASLVDAVGFPDGLVRAFRWRAMGEVRYDDEDAVRVH